MTTTQYFVFVAITIEKVCMSMSDSIDDDTATGGSDTAVQITMVESTCTK